MSLASDLALGVRTLQAHAPGQFTWNGTTYDCLRGSSGLGQDLAVGGFQENYAFSLTVLVSLLPARPKTGDYFTVDGIDYKVATVRADPQNAAYYRVDLLTPDN